MLYVFHVEPGTMLRFDMSLALESVEHLKQSIEQRSRIPVDKQVLLVSGGDSLDNSETICSYSAGTDTNPIYLFSKSVIESTTPPCASIDYGSDLDFNEKVAEMQALPASYNTVVQRTQLAIQFHEYAKDVTKKCERLVHDQHLQQQGWAAVVANLEDITVEFKRKTEICEKSFSDYLDEHENHLKFLQHFHDDLQILSKIPILSALLEAEDVKLPDDAIEGESDRKPEESGEITKSVSLLDWISSADSKSTMEQLFEHCKRGLEQFDNAVIQTLHTETRTALDVADKHNMKEVKGLGERLYGLESLMVEARRCVQQQADLAHSFQANQQRAGNLGDVSVLPDLCASHRNQLTVAQRNNQQLCDIRRRCVKAKEELSENLYHRLKWVMHVENLMVDANHKLVIYYENLKRLRQHLEVLQQIHLAPATYLTAVAEVVRRRAFSQAFLLWASELACHLLTIHNDEVTRRKDFHSVFQGHFLSSLFPGMEDLPPNFATQAPSVFDSSLPKLTAEDIAQLRQNLTDVGDEVPKLAELRETLETAVGTIGTTSAAINDFFLVKSRLKSQLDGDTDDGGCCPDDEEAEDKLVQVVTEATCFGKSSLVPAEGDSRVIVTGHHQAATLGQHLKDWDKGCESETDTEEFEKVCQSPLAALPPHSPLATDGATTTTGGNGSIPPPRDEARHKQETADASTITEVCQSPPPPIQTRYVTPPDTVIPPRKPPRLTVHKHPANIAQLKGELIKKSTNTNLETDKLAKISLGRRESLGVIIDNQVVNLTSNCPEIQEKSTLMDTSLEHKSVSNTNIENHTEKLSNLTGEDNSQPSKLKNTQQMSFSSNSSDNSFSFTHVRIPSLESIDEQSQTGNNVASSPDNNRRQHCCNNHLAENVLLQESPLETVDSKNSIKPDVLSCSSDKSTHYRVRKLSVNNNAHNNGHNNEHNNEYNNEHNNEYNNENNSVVLATAGLPEFVNEEFYLDESLPSSLCGCVCAGDTLEGADRATDDHVDYDYARELDTANDVVALLQDNLETSHLENTRLKTLLSKMALLSQQAIIQLRRELTELKSLCLANRSTFETQVESLSSSWENLTLERDFKERENIQKLSSSHGLQLSAVQRQLAAQHEEIKTLKHENICLESTVKELQDETDRVKSEKIVNEARLNKELTVALEEVVISELKHSKNVKELQDKLLHQHRADIDSLRSRFRLMSVETNNSEEMRKKYEADRENAVLETILVESQKHAKVLDEQNKTAERLLAETIAQLAADKDKQIQVLVDREQKMRLECAKNKNSLQQLAEEGQTSRSELEARVDQLEREKRMLTEDLEFERGKRSLDVGGEDLSGSVAPFDGKVDVATSPIKSCSTTREKLTRSQTSLIRSGKLSIDTCSVGDYVLVLWDEEHGNYIIVQTANYIFFLHSDCVPLLEEYKQQSTQSADLQEDDGVAMSSSGGSKGKFYCVAEVVDKEYCHARRNCNRFNVPRGTKFYRVRVKLLPSTGRDLSRSLQQSSSLLSNTSSTAAAPSNTATTTMSQSTGSTSTVTVMTSCPVTGDDSGACSTTTADDATTVTMCQSLPSGGVTSTALQQQQQLEDTSGGGSFDELSTSTGENNSTNR